MCGMRIAAHSFVGGEANFCGTSSAPSLHDGGIRRVSSYPSRTRRPAPSAMRARKTPGRIDPSNRRCLGPGTGSSAGRILTRRFKSLVHASMREYGVQCESVSRKPRWPREDRPVRHLQRSMASWRAKATMVFLRTAAPSKRRDFIRFQACQAG